MSTAKNGLNMIDHVFMVITLFVLKNYPYIIENMSMYTRLNDHVLKG